MLPVEIIGINEFGYSADSRMYAGRPLSWVRDSEQADVEASWAFLYRDVLIAGPLGEKIEVYNVLANDLTIAANRAALKSKLLAAATPADSDNDRLPDYWERWAFGSLSRNGASLLPDGTKVLSRYAHCGDAVQPGGLPRLVALGSGETLAFSLVWTQRRGTAMGLMLTPEFGLHPGDWVQSGHGFEDWSVRPLYDGSGGDVVEWRSTTALPYPFARVKAVLP